MQYKKTYGRKDWSHAASTIVAVKFNHYIRWNADESITSPLLNVQEQKYIDV